MPLGSRLAATIILATLLFVAVGEGVGRSTGSADGLAVAASGHLLGAAPSITTHAGKSYYFAGWTLNTTTKPFDHVIGSWIIPRHSGACGSTVSYAAFDTAMEGSYLGSPTAVTIGTMMQCVSGTVSYYAWYEFQPYGSLTRVPLVLHAGNVFSGAIGWATGNNWTLQMENWNSSKTWSGYTTSFHGGRTSVSWGVSVTGVSPTSLYPLFHFATAKFGQTYTGILFTCNATIGSNTWSIAALVKHGAVATVFTMYRYSTTTKVMVSPSALASDGRSFSFTWKSAGP